MVGKELGRGVHVHKYNTELFRELCTPTTLSSYTPTRNHELSINSYMIAADL